MVDQVITYEEAKENLNEYNLSELLIEAERFGLNNISSLTKEQIIEKLLKESKDMELVQ